MERREFLQHSVLIAGATMVGFSVLKFEDALATVTKEKRAAGQFTRGRLHGSPRTGCARYSGVAEFPEMLIR